MFLREIRCRLLIASALLAVGNYAYAVETDSEQVCQRQIDRFVGMQNHVKQLGDNSVPAMSVGLTPAQIDAITEQFGACSAWQRLVASLQQQHGTVLDKTEQKTGLPSPKR
ncbi:hypothetical protein K0504_07895 [Neiella marina]|uniref:Secreted protein n=1 Tax=Neiella holothuriorum TaxID=2870530 RepID=A0ABS7EFF2_9GAMM|nr:hypothetical protein [Neiella holothuriorum]MBW8190955.1 hypothetical protein [Neiella holothuriorum]